MITICSGITGSGRASYIEKVVKYASGHGKKVDLIDIGPKMFEKALQLRVRIPRDKILDLDFAALRFLRAAVFEEISHGLDKYRSDDRDLMISLHMCFRWRRVLMPAFDYYYLTLVKPDVYVTIIDSVANIVKRIWTEEDLAHWRDRFSLKEILIWQDEEIFVTSLVSDILGTPFYIIPSVAQPEMLYNILYHVELPKKKGLKPSMIKAYLSYPMAMVRDNVELQREKDELVRKLTERNVIVFDPGLIEDMRLVERASESSSDVIELEDLHIKLPVKEVMDASKDVGDQTVARDYRFIDQSDIVIVFYPVRELSAGVLSEMMYAYTHMKNVYSVFTHKPISPFFSTYSTKIFSSVDDLLEFIEELVRCSTKPQPFG